MSDLVNIFYNWSSILVFGKPKGVENNKQSLDLLETKTNDDEISQLLNVDSSENRKTGSITSRRANETRSCNTISKSIKLTPQTFPSNMDLACSTSEASIAETFAINSDTKRKALWRARARYAMFVMDNGSRSEQQSLFNNFMTTNRSDGLLMAKDFHDSGVDFDKLDRKILKEVEVVLKSTAGTKRGRYKKLGKPKTKEAVKKQKIDGS